MSLSVPYSNMEFFVCSTLIESTCRIRRKRFFLRISWLVDGGYLLMIVLCAAVAIDWRRQLVYFSTSRDQVHRIALNATGQQQPAADGADAVRSPAEVVYQAGSRAGSAGLRLSVDWLYDALYVADQNTVSMSHAPACCHSNRATPARCSRVCVCSHLLERR